MTITTAAGAAPAGSPRMVKVPPGSTTTVPLDAAAANVVRVQTEATDLRGALLSTLRLGKVRGLAVVGLVGTDDRGMSARVVFDPHAGS